MKILAENIKHMLMRATILPYLIIFAVLFSTYRIYPSGDTQALLNGLGVALSCLSDTPMKIPCGAGVIHFPIFQYLVGAPFKAIGLNNDVIINIFGKMSVAWTVISAWVFWQVGIISAGRAGGHLSLIMLLSGCLLWYMTSSFNEAASFSLFALLAYSVISQWRITFVCVIALASTITKEVAFPFVLYFMFLSYFARELRLAKVTNILHFACQFFKEYKLAVLSIIAGIGINLAFNYFRFGGITNLNNLDPILFNPWGYVPIFFADLFISPAGGLAFTWLSLCVLLIVPTIFIIRDHSTKWLMLLTLLGLIAVNIGLARWFSPFGWVAWAPRLTFPFLGSIGILVIYIVAPHVINYYQKIGTRKGIYIIFLVAAASSLPNITIRLDDSAFFSKMFAPGKVEIESGIASFTVQSAPAPLYQKAAAAAYSRNIIIPTSVDIALKRWPIILLWLGGLFLISRLVFLPDTGLNRKTHATSKSNYEHSKTHVIYRIVKEVSLGPTRQLMIGLVALSLLIGGSVFTLVVRENCPTCVYLMQRVGWVGTIANYQFTPPQENLTKALDAFPPTLPMVEIRIQLIENKNLDSVYVLAPNGLGNWTTHPIKSTWGIGVIDKDGDVYKINNAGQRVDKMNLPHGRKLTLWIPDNGNLSKCPELQVELVFEGGSPINTVADCKPGGRNEK